MGEQIDEAEWDRRYYGGLYDEPHPDCRCDGSGIIITCPDDLCRGAGHCIHGDGMKLCPCGAL